jgi:hypothetical protein
MIYTPKLETLNNFKLNTSKITIRNTFKIKTRNYIKKRMQEGTLKPIFKKILLFRKTHC